MITTDFNKDTKHEILRADSIAEYIERAKDLDGVSSNNSEAMYKELNRDNGEGRNWYGADTLEQALKIMELGDPATADKIADMAQSIDVPPLTSIKRRQSRGDSGDFLDMQAVYCGNLSNAWTKCASRTVVSKRQICIVIPMQGLSDEPSATFFWRSVAGLAMAEKLSEAGFTIKIEGDYTAEVNSSKFKKFTHRITLKEYSQPLDIAGLAGVMCMAGFKRTFGFANYYKSFDLYTNGTGRTGWSSINSEKLAPEELIGFESASTELKAKNTVKQMAQLLEFRLDGNSRLDDMESWAKSRL